MRPVSLCIWGHPDNPRWAGVFHEGTSPDWTDWICLHKANKQQIVDFYRDNMVEYQPTIISATGIPPNTAYLIVMVRRTKPVAYTGSTWQIPERAQFDLTSGDVLDPASFQYWNAKAFSTGLILKSATIYGDPPRFAAIWWPNDKLVSWDYSIDDDPASHQKLFEAYASGYMMPAHVTLSTKKRYMSIWTDTWFTPNWHARHNLTQSKLEDEIDQVLADGGRWPITLQANGIGDGLRYAVTFAEYPRIEPEPNVWTVTGHPQYRSDDAPLIRFDNFVKRYMRRRGIRATSLAISRHGRLVYAKGFTLAPPGYPVTQPETLFRVGSISKWITALALLRIIDDCIQVGLWPGKTTVDDWLDTGLLDVLARFQWPTRFGLLSLNAQLPGGDNEWRKAAWRTITLRDLVWHGAGLRPDLPWSMTDILGAAKASYDAYGWVSHFASDVFLGEPPTYPIRFEWVPQYFAQRADAFTAWPSTRYQYGQGFLFLQLAIEALVKAVHGDTYTDYYRVGTVPEQDRERHYDRTYEKFVQEAVLAPLGIRGPTIGAIEPYSRDLEPDCSYPPSAETRRERGLPAFPYAVDPEFPPDPDKDPNPWYVGPRWMLDWHRLRKGKRALYHVGGDNMRIHGAHGSWLFSAVHLVRLLASFDLPHSPILSDEAVYEMLSAAPLMGNDILEYANLFGITILHGIYQRAYKTGSWLSIPGFAPSYDPSAEILIPGIEFAGQLAGGRAYCLRKADGVSFAFMVNSDLRPDKPTWGDRDILWLLSELARGLQANAWPSEDMFPMFTMPSFNLYHYFDVFSSLYSFP